MVSKIHITHIDSGTGFDEKSLRTYNHILDHPEVRKNGYSIGIYNIASRLRLTLGENSTIVFSNELGKGARIDIIFPYVRYRSADSENEMEVTGEYYIVQGIVKIISESFTEFDCIYQAYSTEQAKRIIYLMYFIRNLTRLLVLTLHPCALIRQRSFLKEPTGEWILLQKKLDFPAVPTFINNSKK